MSQENVEFVRNLVSGASGMDKQSLLAVLPELIAQTCHPDIEWVEHLDRADRRVYHGHEGVRESWERWLEQWGEYAFEVEQLVDYGDDVLIVAREHARGRASGANVSSRIYSVFTVREGMLARYREFYVEELALEAVGLAE
ncbi:MAG TPA: nuclear transport factor 2 family protein [Microbacteriaceae bacterium]|jgi:ketosteroid isomerase-like protein|nr:nuclear transport factor 2 family protein [Microbacteriaceae bacterium]